MKVPHIPFWLRLLSVGAGVALWVLTLVFVGAVPIVREIGAVVGFLLIMGGIFGGPLT